MCGNAHSLEPTPRSAHTRRRPGDSAPSITMRPRVAPEHGGELGIGDLPSRSTR